MEIARREEAVKKVEEALALKRAARLEERRRKAQEVLLFSCTYRLSSSHFRGIQVVKQMQAEEFILAGGMDYSEWETKHDPPTGLIPLVFTPCLIHDLNLTISCTCTCSYANTAIVISTQRMVKDLHIIREKMVETMARQRLVEEKYNLFKAQCESVKNDTARLRRAIQMIKANPAVLQANVDPSKEIANLVSILNLSPSPNRAVSAVHRPHQHHYCHHHYSHPHYYHHHFSLPSYQEGNLASKEETYQELRALAVSREAQLAAASSSVQKMKVMVAEINKKWTDRLNQIYKMEANYAKVPDTNPNPNPITKPN